MEPNGSADDLEIRFAAALPEIQGDCERFAASLVTRGVNGYEDASDLVQFAMVEAWKGFVSGTFRDDRDLNRSLKSYVCTTIKRRFLEKKRRHKLFCKFQEYRQRTGRVDSFDDGPLQVDDLDEFMEEFAILRGLYSPQHFKYIVAAAILGDQSLIERYLGLNSNTIRKYQTEIRRWSNHIKNVFATFAGVFVMPRAFAFTLQVQARVNFRPDLKNAFRECMRESMKPYERDDEMNSLVMQSKYWTDLLCPEFYALFLKMRYMDRDAALRVFGDFRGVVARMAQAIALPGTFAEMLNTCDEVMEGLRVCLRNLVNEKKRYERAESFVAETFMILANVRQELEFSERWRVGMEHTEAFLRQIRANPTPRSSTVD